MGKIEIVKSIMDSIEQGRVNDVKKNLTDDFTFSGPVPAPIKAGEWLSLHEKMSKGIPDLSFNLKKLNESGNVVNGSVQLSGTHSRDMPALLPGTANVPATNKKISLPEENIVFTFKGDKISSIAVEKIPNAGIAGLLRQLGVSIPSLK